jgi:hypothetical protein
MTWNFGDSFDLYAAVGDMYPSYWDSSPSSNVTIAGAAGRFAGSRALGFQGNSANPGVRKASNVNDAVHHLVVAFTYNSAFAGATAYPAYFTFYDGATAQCTIQFNVNNGSIVLCSGTSAGSVIATYSSAWAINTWTAFEFEVVINGSTGSIAVRKNGNTSNDFFLGSLNTAPSGNAYANALGVGCNNNPAGPSTFIDDLFWESGAATGTWLGDIRCYTRYPASDVSVQFSKGTTRNVVTIGGLAYNSTANRSWYLQQTMPYAGSVASFQTTITNGATVNIKGAIFADNAGVPGAVLGTATSIITNPVAGPAIFTFSPPVAVTAGQKIWIAWSVDASITGLFSAQVGSNSTSVINSTSYASFPVANPPSLSVNNIMAGTTFINTTNNADLVNEPQEDGLTSYIYDSTPGDTDFYSIASIPNVPTSVIATVLRAYAQKSDAGSRVLAAQLKSGATTVAANIALSSSGFQWVWRMDLTDPNTGSAWAPTAVDVVQIGPKLIA